MTENTVFLRLGIRNEKTREDLEEVISLLEGFHLQSSIDSDPCDLLILEAENDNGKDFQLIHELQASGKVKEVFLTSARLEPNLLLQALRAGVKEFFSQPIQKEEVKTGLLKFRERRGFLQQKAGEKKRGKIIHFISSKGGVGTTTIAVNLAASLSESSGSSVALIDMSLPFGQIPIFLNTESSFNWGEVLRDISRVDETFLMGVLSKHRSGVYVMPSPASLEDLNVETPEMVEKLLSLMRNLFDFILVDGGQRLDPVSLRILQMSDTVLMITVLNLPCLTNAKKLLWTFQKLGFPTRETIRIIANRYQKKSSISLKEAEEAVSEKIHWLVANDYHLTMSAINQGKTISEVASGSEVGKSLRELAGTFISQGQKKRIWT
ncbi:MAG: AAA family ATPase [Thermodesulfobacteriota bacterium]